MTTTIRLFLERISNRTILLILSAFFVGTVTGSILSHVHLGDAANWWAWADSILQNLGAEMCGAIVTFLLIGVLGERRQTKEQLIRAMGSDVRDVAIPAVKELGAYGWLYDGSLRGVYFGSADLEKAVLTDADLAGAHLWRSKLAGANLSYTKLEGANLECANLEGVNLSFANLAGANLSFANLEGANLEEARFSRRTRLPDGTRYNPDQGPEQLDRFTDPTHPDFWRSDDPRSPAYRPPNTKP